MKNDKENIKQKSTSFTQTLEPPNFSKSKEDRFKKTFGGMTNSSLIDKTIKNLKKFNKINEQHCRNKIFMDNEVSNSNTNFYEEIIHSKYNIEEEKINFKDKNKIFFDYLFKSEKDSGRRTDLKSIIKTSVKSIQNLDDFINSKINFNLVNNNASYNFNFSGREKGKDNNKKKSLISTNIFNFHNPLLIDKAMKSNGKVLNIERFKSIQNEKIKKKKNLNLCNYIDLNKSELNPINEIKNKSKIANIEKNNKSLNHKQLKITLKKKINLNLKKKVKNFIIKNYELNLNLKDNNMGLYNTIKNNKFCLPLINKLATNEKTIFNNNFNNKKKIIKRPKNFENTGSVLFSQRTPKRKKYLSDVDDNILDNCNKNSQPKNKGSLCIMSSPEINGFYQENKIDFNEFRILPKFEEYYKTIKINGNNHKRKIKLNDSSSRNHSLNNIFSNSDVSGIINPAKL